MLIAFLLFVSVVIVLVLLALLAASPRSAADQACDDEEWRASTDASAPAQEPPDTTPHHGT